MNIDKIVEQNDFGKDVLKYVGSIKKNYALSELEIREYALRLINKEIARIIEQTPYYKELYERGQFPAHVESLEEFQKIRFVLKQTLRDNYPFGFLGVPMSEVVSYGESTGTSGPPTSSFMTKQDWEENIARVTIHLSNFYDKNDIIFLMLPLELTFSSIDMNKSLWNIGSAVVAIGAKNQICPMSRVVDMFIKVKPTSLICSPTRAIRLYFLLKSRGYEPSKLSLKKILYIGETCSEKKLEKIKEMWNIELLSIYGSTETNSLALPCENNQSHLTEDRFYFELVDPVSGEVIKDGNRGELVVSTLRHKAFPLIRYRTGDYVEISKNACKCGLHFRTIKHLGRWIDGFTVEGKRLMKNDIEQCVLSVAGVGCNFAHYLKESELYVEFDVEDGNEDGIIELVKEAVRKEFGISVHALILDRERYFKVIDSSLKPGSIDWGKQGNQ